MDRDRSLSYRFPDTADHAIPYDGFFMRDPPSFIMSTITCRFRLLLLIQLSLNIIAKKSNIYNHGKYK